MKYEDSVLHTLPLLKCIAKGCRFYLARMLWGIFWVFNMEYRFFWNKLRIFLISFKLEKMDFF